MYKFNERKETPRQQDFLLPQDEQGEYSNALKNVTVRGKSVNGQFEQCVYNKGNRYTNGINEPANRRDPPTRSSEKRNEYQIIRQPFRAMSSICFRSWHLNPRVSWLCMHHVLLNVAETIVKLGAVASTVWISPEIMSKGVERKMNRNQMTAAQVASWLVKSFPGERGTWQTGPSSANKILSAPK